MKKHLWKFLTLVFLILPYSVSLPMYEEMGQNETVANTQTQGNTAMPYADVIVVKTHEKNGVRQYRRWNKTKNCWVDPDWIDMP